MVAFKVLGVYISILLTKAKNGSNTEIASSVHIPSKVSTQSQQIEESFGKHPEEVGDGQILDKRGDGHAETITVRQGGSGSQHKHNIEADQYDVRHDHHSAKYCST